MIVAAYFLDALSGKACPTADDVMKNLGQIGRVGAATNHDEEITKQK
ncbi:hypothetical protein SOVF_185950 [Spinacia oleracea]|nr:hypothetical protein SOVF_185950 [Spinacia oleracea]